KDMFTNGKVSGNIVMYAIQKSNSGTIDDSGFSINSIGLAYETAEFNGFKSSFSFRGNNKIYEVEDGDYADDEAPKAIIDTANISYSNKYFTVIAGRQAISLEWVEDYHEAYVASITTIPNTIILVAHTNRTAVADTDDVLKVFRQVNENRGANIIDIKYAGIDSLALNAYYYNAPDLANWYGTKVDYDTDMIGATLHYAASKEEVATTKDGSVFAAELRAKMNAFSANLGYIITDKDGAIGSMRLVGESINPLEENHNQVYTTDANTIYLGLGYKLDDFSLNAMYGSTKYASYKQDEINLIAEYGINDEFTVGTIFVNVNTDDTTLSYNDYNTISLTISYAF
ncbi:MAG: hypothetical protein ACJAWW_001853, partial [Sulfurimonas sp.]